VVHHFAVVHPRTIGVYAYLGAGGATLGGLSLAAALLGDRRGRFWWPMSRVGSSGMLRACGVTELITEGAERLADCRPAVVMANHESLFDPAVLMRCASLPLRFVVKEEVSRVPIFGAALAAMGHVFVGHGDAADGQSSLARAAALIGTGSTVLVFPEGTRGAGAELLPFRTGGFRLAREAGVPILPVALAGTGAILPKRGGWRRAGRVALVVGDPIATGASDASSIVGLLDRVRGEMNRLRDRARALVVC
jgi:1-acyl-sn-glycerol-3-phosphate acyltransferase